MSLVLLWGSGGAWAAAVDPPATGTGGSQGGFFSSLKQALNKDMDRDDVWAHFDVESSSGSHRFYCLLDPKTGKREPNGVSGEPVVRHDGTTGIKEPAVSPTRCAEAEQKGTLVTTGYVVPAGTPAAAAAPVPGAAPVPPPAAVAAPMSAPVPAPVPVQAAAPVQTAAVAPGAPAATAVSADDHSRDRAYIRQAESDWAESAATRDVSVLERILSEDFVGVDVQGGHYTKADAIKEYRNRPSTFASNHLGRVEIRFYGPTAVAQGDESWEKKDGSSGRYVWTDTWVQQDGKWRVVAAEDLVPPAEESKHR